MSDPARRIRTTATAIQHLALAARIRLDSTVKRLDIELDCYDGYKTDCRPKAAPAGKGTPGSTVEHAALGPDERNDEDDWAKGPRAVMAELQDLLDAAVLALRTVCNECDARNPERIIGQDVIDAIRCAVIPKGACTQWADPTRSDGMCIDHGRTTDTNARRLRDHRARAER